MNRTVIVLSASLLLSIPSKGQAFDKMLTSPPSPGPLTMDTSRVPQTYRPPIVSPQTNDKPHVSTNKKPSNIKLQEKYRRAEDSAWQEFINRPASPETKFAPKYINTKTGK